MFGFMIANLIVDESTFEVPSQFGNGKWEFKRTENYDELISSIGKGMCGNTYRAFLEVANPQLSDAELKGACDEIIDICMVLSFLTARSVTPTGSAEYSEIKFINMGDDFIPCRAIVGFPPILPNSLTSFFSDWITSMHHIMGQRRLRLQLSHWLSGLTCFSMEDVYLSAGVQMDIVKQVERVVTKNFKLTYFEGMTSASSRYLLTPLGQDYKNMRNDIVHEGVLSGSNFVGKSKGQCSIVIANTLNWLDSYVLAVLGKKGQVQNHPRWKGSDFEYGLASISVR